MLAELLLLLLRGGDWLRLRLELAPGEARRGMASRAAPTCTCPLGSAGPSTCMLLVSPKRHTARSAVKRGTWTRRSPPSSHCCPPSLRTTTSLKAHSPGGSGSSATQQSPSCQLSMGAAAASQLPSSAQLPTTRRCSPKLRRQLGTRNVTRANVMSAAAANAAPPLSRAAVATRAGASGARRVRRGRCGNEEQGSEGRLGLQQLAQSVGVERRPAAAPPPRAPPPAALTWLLLCRGAQASRAVLCNALLLATVGTAGAEEERRGGQRARGASGAGAQLDEATPHTCAKLVQPLARSHGRDGGRGWPWQATERVSVSACGCGCASSPAPPKRPGPVVRVSTNVN